MLNSKLMNVNMRIALVLICLAGSAFSQETYLSRENAFSAGLFFGRYNSASKWGARCSYSLKGFLDLSYSRSSILTKAHTANFQDEYFLRMYFPQERRIFFSVGAGSLYQKVSAELWKNFPLEYTSDGVGLEGGVHFVTEASETRRSVVSISYLYFEPITKLRTPAGSIVDIKFDRAFSFEVAVVYFLGRIALVVGPKFALDSDFKNVFLGLHSSFLLRH